MWTRVCGGVRVGGWIVWDCVHVCMRKRDCWAGCINSVAAACWCCERLTCRAHYVCQDPVVVEPAPH